MRRFHSTLAILAMLMGCYEPAPVGSTPEPDVEPTTAPAEPAPPPLAPQPEAPREQTLVLGIISADAAQALERYGRLSRVFAEVTGRARGEVFASANADRVLAGVCDGAVDILLDTVGNAFVAHTRCAATYVMVAAKRGTLRYSSSIFVRSDSNIRDIDGLVGETILFEDPTSTSAYLLPRALLESSGHTLTTSRGANVPGSIRYEFALDELNIIGGVVHGRAAAGALSGNDMEDYADADVRVIAESDLVPRQLVVGGATLTEEEIAALRERGPLLHEDVRATPALDASKVERFDTLSGADLDVIAAVGPVALPSAEVSP